MPREISSPLFQNESEQLDQQQLYRLFQIDTAFIGEGSGSSGSTSLFTSTPSAFEIGQWIRIKGVPGIYCVASLDTGRVILNTDLRAEVAQPVEVYAVVLLVDANHEVEYQGATYCQYPMQLQAMETTTENQDISVQLIMANVDKNIEYLIHEYDGLRGRRVTVLTVFANHTAKIYTPLPDGTYDIQPNPEYNPQAFVRDILQIDSFTSSAKAMQFTLTPALRLDVKLPRRRYVGGTCYFRYKDPETCGYSGTLPACNHTLADCIRHGNQLRFGGFPGVTMKKRIAL
jgi:lambda family phage minor tail protein L